MKYKFKWVHVSCFKGVRNGHRSRIVFSAILNIDIYAVSFCLYIEDVCTLIKSGKF